MARKEVSIEPNLITRDMIRERFRKDCSHIKDIKDHATYSCEYIEWLERELAKSEAQKAEHMQLCTTCKYEPTCESAGRRCCDYTLR